MLPSINKVDYDKLLLLLLLLLLHVLLLLLEREREREREIRPGRGKEADYLIHRFRSYFGFIYSQLITSCDLVHSFISPIKMANFLTKICDIFLFILQI